MLLDFFKLNEPFQVFDETTLANHIRISRDLRSVLYQPDKWISKPSHFKSFFFTNVSLSKTTFKGMTFTECQFEDCLFIGSTFIDIEFHRCKFINCNFYKATFDNCYIDPDTILFDKKYRRTISNIGVHLYQQLYENSSRSRQPDFEMKADIEFRRWKRWQLGYDLKIGKVGRFEWFLKWAASLTYECLTGFGYKPWRFVVTTLVFFSAVSLINLNLLPGKLRLDGQVIHNMTLPDSIFYTYSMMTALGFSTIVPETAFAKILAVSEALCGIGWLGIFTSLLVKRFIK